MPVFVNPVTGEAIEVADQGLVGADALAALGWEPLGNSDEPAPKVGDTPDMPAEPVPLADVPRPSDSASRAAWVAYANALSLDVEGLKRNEIRNLVENKES